MKKLIENYHKKTPDKYRAAGDLALFAALMEGLVQIAIDILNTKTLTTETGAKIVGVSLILFKFWTKTRAEKNHYEGKT